jgi:hypothetical protein
MSSPSRNLGNPPDYNPFQNGFDPNNLFLGVDMNPFDHHEFPDFGGGQQEIDDFYGIGVDLSSSLVDHTSPAGLDGSFGNLPQPAFNSGGPSNFHQLALNGNPSNLLQPTHNGVGMNLQPYDEALAGQADGHTNGAQESSTHQGVGSTDGVRESSARQTDGHAVVINDPVTLTVLNEEQYYTQLGKRVKEHRKRKTRNILEDGNEVDFPATDGEKQALVKKLIVAMKNTTNILDKPCKDGRPGQAAQRFDRGYYPDEHIEMAAWAVMVRSSLFKCQDSSRD